MYIGILVHRNELFLTLRRPIETMIHMDSWYFELQENENENFFYPIEKFLWPREVGEIFTFFDFFV